MLLFIFRFPLLFTASTWRCRPKSAWRRTPEPNSEQKHTAYKFRGNIYAYKMTSHYHDLVGASASFIDIANRKVKLNNIFLLLVEIEHAQQYLVSNWRKKQYCTLKNQVNNYSSSKHFILYFKWLKFLLPAVYQRRLLKTPPSVN